MNLGGKGMISFINSFLSYVLVVVAFVAVMFVGGFIGLKLRKSKDANEAALAVEEEKVTEYS